MKKMRVIAAILLVCMMVSLFTACSILPLSGTYTIKDGLIEQSFTFKEDAAPGRPAMMDYIDNECKRGLYFNSVKKVHLKNVSMSGQDGDRLITLNVDEVIEE